MPAKATEEYRIALMSLLSQLSELERLGNDFFGKIENTFSTPYNGPEAKADYQQIMTVLQQLETNARGSGLLSLSNTTSEEGKTDQAPAAKNLATRNSETMQAVEQNFSERSRLVANVQAAINTSSHRGTH